MFNFNSKALYFSFAFINGNESSVSMKMYLVKFLTINRLP